MKLTTLLAGASLALLGSAAMAASHATVLDADNDGMLTEAEFAPAAEMGMVFTGVDSDGDGMVSQAEFNDAARAKAGEESGSDSLDPRQAAEYDKLTRMFSAARAERAELDFATADANGDGMLDEEERATFDGS